MARVTPNQLNLWSAEMSSIYQALEIDIIKMVIKRYKFTGEPDILEWQAKIMSELHLLNHDVYSHISKATGITEKAIEAAVKDVGYSSVKDIDDYLERHMPLQPKPNGLDNILKAYSDQTFIDISNKVNQTLVSTQYGFGMVAQGYTDVLNNTTAGYLSGMYTHQEALEKAILEWADKGVLNTFIDKGGNTWSLERYVDTVLKSTLNRTYNEVRTSRMADYDIYTVKMSQVYDAAERCAYCQGRVLDMREPSGSEYPSIYDYGYGTAGGTLGINCRHSIYPFLPGVNIDREPTIDPKEAIERSKVREKQRQLERGIRKTKKNIIAMKELGSKSVGKYEQLLLRQQASMRNLLDGAPWLKRQYGREKVITPKDILMKGSNSVGISNYNAKKATPKPKEYLNESITSKLTKEQADAYREVFKGSNKEVKDVWEKYQDDLVLGDAKYKGTAHQKNGVVNINAEIDLKGSLHSKSTNTFFHEFGHSIDYLAGNGKYASPTQKLSNGKTLGETVVSDVERKVKEVRSQLKVNAKEARRKIAGQLNFGAQDKTSVSVSDLFSGATDYKIDTMSGHGKSYWRPPFAKIRHLDLTVDEYRNQKLGQEAFAEFTAAGMMDEKELAILKEWLPETYSMYFELLKVIKGGK